MFTEHVLFFCLKNTKIKAISKESNDHWVDPYMERMNLGATHIVAQLNR